MTQRMKSNKAAVGIGALIPISMSLTQPNPSYRHPIPDLTAIAPSLITCFQPAK